jgi:hypothetical protein
MHRPPSGEQHRAILVGVCWDDEQTTGGVVVEHGHQQVVQGVVAEKHRRL